MRRHGPWHWSTTFRVCGSKAQIWNALPCTSWLSAPPVFGRRAIMAGFASAPHMLWYSPCYWVPVRLSYAILLPIPGHSAVDHVPHWVRSVGEIPRSRSRPIARGHSRRSAARHLLNPSLTRRSGHRIAIPEQRPTFPYFPAVPCDTSKSRLHTCQVDSPRLATA